MDKCLYKWRWVVVVDDHSMHVHSLPKIYTIRESCEWYESKDDCVAKGGKCVTDIPNMWGGPFLSVIIWNIDKNYEYEENVEQK